MLRLVSTCIVLLALSALGTACSTPISPYSPLEDEDDEPALDAGVGGAPRDAGTRRDAGSVTAGGSAECARVPLSGFYGSLFDDGCASRKAEACATRSGQVVQQAVNQWLTDLAIKCGVPANVALGVTFNRSGCPNFYGYGDSALHGSTAVVCVENELNNRRLACAPQCALMGSISR